MAATASRYVRVTVPMVKRMRELRAAGLGAEAVAAVIALDFGARPCRATVDQYAPRSSATGHGLALTWGQGRNRRKGKRPATT